VAVAVDMGRKMTCVGIYQGDAAPHHLKISYFANKKVGTSSSPAEKSDSDFWRFLARKNQKIREKSE